MPLSEEELRALEQMERALVQEDPKLASTMRGTRLRRSSRRRAIMAGLVFAVGVAILMTGAITRHAALGILGFLVMLCSATVAVTAMRGPGGSQRPVSSRPGVPPTSMLDRFGSPWRRRHDDGA